MQTQICHACSKPVAWKGAHCCGYGPYTCTLIKNLMMMMNPLLISGCVHHYIWRSPFLVLGSFWWIFSLLLYFPQKIFPANCVDPDQTPHLAASELGLHCLCSTPIQVSGQKGVNGTSEYEENICMYFVNKCLSFMSKYQKKKN